MDTIPSGLRSQSSNPQPQDSSNSQSQGFVPKSDQLSLILDSRVNGWDKRLFAEEINPDFVCVLCDGVCRQAVEVNCESAHIFCEGCIVEYLTNHLSCPHCQKILESTTTTSTGGATSDKSQNDLDEQAAKKIKILEVNQNFYVRKKIANLPVICPRSFANQGNAQSDNEKETETEKETIFAPTESITNNTSTTATGTESMLKKEEKRESNSCSWRGKLSGLEDHLKEACEYRFHKCPFHESGCNFQNTNFEIDIHLHKEYVHHLTLLLNDLKFVKEQMKIQNDQIQALAVENRDLRAIVGMLNDDKRNGAPAWNWEIDDARESDSKNELDVGFGGINSRFRQGRKKNVSSDPPQLDKNNLLYSQSNPSLKDTEKNAPDDIWNFPGYEGNTMTWGDTWDNDGIWSDWNGFQSEPQVNSALSQNQKPSETEWRSFMRKDGVDIQVPWTEKFQVNEAVSSGERITHLFKCFKYTSTKEGENFKEEGEISWIQFKNGCHLDLIVKQSSLEDISFRLKTVQQIRRKKLIVEWIGKSDDIYLDSIPDSIKFFIQFQSSQAADQFEKALHGVVECQTCLHF